jgi:hypothetical protein
MVERRMNSSSEGGLATMALYDPTEADEKRDEKPDRA